ncbi:hypothetical protein CDS [Bradyrhizobium sp.]|nr:hypothetical protein CDS [Bradyrhizobium sp.]
MTGRPRNDLLRRLSAQDFELLAPHLQSVEVAANHVLHHAGDGISVVHFFPAALRSCRSRCRLRMTARSKVSWWAARAGSVFPQAAARRRPFPASS